MVNNEAKRDAKGHRREAAIAMAAAAPTWEARATWQAVAIAIEASMNPAELLAWSKE